MRTSLLLAIAAALPAAAQDVSFQETLLATIPEGFSTDGGSVRGPDGKDWRRVYPIVWSPDGRRVAYTGIRGGQRHPIIGDEVGEAWEFLSSPMFAGTGESVVFRAGRRTSDTTEEWFLLIDGEKHGRNAWIGAPAFSPDGESIAYWTQPDAKIQKDGFYDRSKQVLCLAQRKRDGWEIEAGEATWGDAMSLVRPTWTADSKLAVTTASADGRWKVIGWGGKKVQEFWSGSSPAQGYTPAPNGKGVAITDSNGYVGLPPGMLRPGVVPDGKTWVVYDDEEFGKAYDNADQPVFSANGKLLACRVQKGRRFGVAVGNEEVKCVDDHVHGIVFDPKGKKLAYVANDGGRPVPNQDRVPGEPGLAGGQTFVVVRNVKGKPDLETTSSFTVIRDLVFSPKGDRLAFCAKDEDGWHVVIDGDVGPAYDDVGAPVFSRKGDQLAHGARSGKELWWRVREVD